MNCFLKQKSIFKISYYILFNVRVVFKNYPVTLLINNKSFQRLILKLKYYYKHNLVMLVMERVFTNL